MKELDELLVLMAALRDPAQGCPWDMAQTFETIAPFTLEEAYEVQDAIAKGDPNEIKTEVGDLLWQVVFYSQMAKEKGWFDFADVVKQLQDKLITRHSSILAEAKAESAEHQHSLWENVKAQERLQKNSKSHSVLADIPLNMPGLMRAQKLQARAAIVGFDWPSIKPVLDKLKEEILEFEQSYEHNRDFAIEELGDILFVCANLARHLRTDAELVMMQANRKFERRFKGIEAQVQMSGKSWEAFSLEALENFWQQVKEQETCE